MPVAALNKMFVLTRTVQQIFGLRQTGMLRTKMNPKTYEFEPETTNTPEDWKRLSIGQTFTINGVLMKIRKVTKKDIILRPVKGDA